jgi:hypothetical protein
VFCIVGDCQRAAARTLGEAALGHCLDAPGDPSKQKLFVTRSGLLAEHLKVLEVLVDALGRTVNQHLSWSVKR